MLSRIRSRATYANVVSTLCLFVLLGGGAYAGSRLAKDSVGARQIKQGAVRSSEVKDASLLAQDFKPGQIQEGVRAYGLVSAAGVLDPAKSKGLGVTKITSQPGAYCVEPTAASGIDPSAVHPVVSADLAEGLGSAHTAQVSSAPFYPAQCPATTGWEIYTQGPSGTNAFVALDAGFSLIVP